MSLLQQREQLDFIAKVVISILKILKLTTQIILFYKKVTCLTFISQTFSRLLYKERLLPQLKEQKKGKSKPEV